jgi:hypothetical protein
MTRKRNHMSKAQPGVTVLMQQASSSISIDTVCVCVCVCMYDARRLLALSQRRIPCDLDVIMTRVKIFNKHIANQ